jgi:hypothetical protein
VHFVNGALVGDPGLDIRKPGRWCTRLTDGTPRLAALEFIGIRPRGRAPQQALEAVRRYLFDQTPAPNRFGLAPPYSQHV